MLRKIIAITLSCALSALAIGCSSESNSSNDASGSNGVASSAGFSEDSSTSQIDPSLVQAWEVENVKVHLPEGWHMGKPYTGSEGEVVTAIAWKGDEEMQPEDLSCDLTIDKDSYPDANSTDDEILDQLKLSFNATEGEISRNGDVAYAISELEQSDGSVYYLYGAMNGSSFVNLSIHSVSEGDDREALRKILQSVEIS